MTRIDPIDQANLLAGHAVSYATAFLDGRQTSAQLGDNADRLFNDLLVLDKPEVSAFLIPIQLLTLVMCRVARHAREEDDAVSTEERDRRWQLVMASLVELVCNESRKIRKH